MAPKADIETQRAYIAEHGRTRPKHAVRNDTRLRLAAVSVLSAAGWDNFSLNKVSQATGITRAALYNRYDSRAVLGIEAWERELFPALTEALQGALDAAGQGPSFARAMAIFAHPTAQVIAAVELLMASFVHVDLTEKVAGPMSDWVRDYCPLPEPLAPGESKPQVDPIGSVQAVAILTWALGLVVFADRPWVAEMDLDPALSRADHALAQPAPARPLPDSTAEYLRQSPFHTDDPRIDLALDHALASIATVGYQRTRLQDVAKAAGVSEAFLLIRFKTKLGLLRAIIDPAYAVAYEAFAAFQQSITDEYGPGIAEAVAWREYLNPHIRDRQILGLETDRLAKHDVTMREITLSTEQQVFAGRLANVSASERAARTGDTHMDFATGHGLPIVGLLLPHAWTLPLNMVTEPYVRGHPFA